ncbi:hypothetical protein GWK47_037247 [Chionoecetes opilio]|uniref:Uncharacterized protein n=1 Tax=Chionoecetes opilio TaxID=41210 RepID=A0A8J4YF60_CHIOP|nr:hypothetical protein GWK47_037247 [Chionoecetes opilio]
MQSETRLVPLANTGCSASWTCQSARVFLPARDVEGVASAGGSGMAMTQGIECSARQTWLINTLASHPQPHHGGSPAVAVGRCPPPLTTMLRPRWDPPAQSFTGTQLP